MKQMKSVRAPGNVGFIGIPSSVFSTSVLFSALLIVAGLCGAGVVSAQMTPLSGASECVPSPEGVWYSLFDWDGIRRVDRVEVTTLADGVYQIGGTESYNDQTVRTIHGVAAISGVGVIAPFHEVSYLRFYGEGEFQETSVYYPMESLSLPVEFDWARLADSASDPIPYDSLVIGHRWRVYRSHQNCAPSLIAD